MTKSLLTATLWLLLLNTALFAQRPHEVMLFFGQPTIQADFKFVEVIDERLIKDNIGFAQKGLTNRKVPVVINGDFGINILNSLNQIIAAGEDAVELVGIVHELTVSEQTSFSSERGTCRIELEIARREDSTYYSLGTYTADIESGGLDVTSQHGNRIMEGLELILRDFSASDWQKAKNAVVVAQENRTGCSINLDSLPNRGFFPSFTTLCTNEPMETFPHQIRNITSDPSITRFKFKANSRQDRKKKVMFISDRGNLFLHASTYSVGTHYVMAKSLGRYFYFEDRYSDPYASAAFGLVGAAASNQKRGIILDTTNGQISLLTHDHLMQLLRLPAEEGMHYLKPVKTWEDREEALLWLNDWYESKE